MFQLSERESQELAIWGSFEESCDDEGRIGAPAIESERVPVRTSQRDLVLDVQQILN